PRPAAEVAAAYGRIDRGYLRRHNGGPSAEVLDLFAERAADYRATVLPVSPDRVAETVAQRLSARSGAYGVPGDLPAEWLAAAGAPRRGTGGRAPSPAAPPRSPSPARASSTTARRRGPARCRWSPTTT